MSKRLRGMWSACMTSLCRALFGETRPEVQLGGRTVEREDFISKASCQVLVTIKNLQMI